MAASEGAFGGAPPLASASFELLSREALATAAPRLAVVVWCTVNRLLPTTATSATAAAAPAIANTNRVGRRCLVRFRAVVSSGVSEVPDILAARWACSAARLALIRSTRCSGMGSGSGSEDSRARTPVGSSSRDGSEPMGRWGLIRVLTSMLDCETVGGDWFWRWLWFLIANVRTVNAPTWV